MSNTTHWLRTLASLYHRLINTTEKLSPTVTSAILLGLRLWIATLFWQSGLTKIANWESTLFLFEYEYETPFLPPNIAACIATIFELTCPFLLTIGLGTRLAVLPLIGMTLTIQFTYAQHHQHFLWLLALFTLLIQGSGRFSWDFLLRYLTFREAGRSPVSAFCLIGAFIAALTLTTIAGHEAFAAATDAEAWLPDLIDGWKSIWEES